MSGEHAKDDPVLQRLVEDLRESLGARLKSVVLYGSAARGDHLADGSDFNVIVVLEPLDPANLEAIAKALRRFTRKGHPIPQLFSPELIAASADSFPIEFVDIRGGRTVLHGEDPFAAVVVEPGPLRLQLEREIKEKLMRLREGYVIVHDRGSALKRLLTRSYPAFAALFRGALHLMNRPVPAHSGEVMVAFCAAVSLDAAPFEEVARLRRGESVERDYRSMFARYYDQLMRAAEAVDRLGTRSGGDR